MKTGIWHEAEQKQPAKSGYYLAFKGMSIADNETKAGYYYWSSTSKEWRDSRISGAHWANVVYWTESDPAAWYDEPAGRSKTKRTVSVAEQDAWRAVEQALEQYEIVKRLAQV